MEALAVLDMPKFHQRLACFTLTPLETLSGSHSAASNTWCSRDWWDRTAQGNQSLYTPSDGCTSGMGLQEGSRRLTVAYTRALNHSSIPGRRSIHYPASFIMTGTVPINFKSLSGTWSIRSHVNLWNSYAGNLKSHFLYTISLQYFFSFYRKHVFLISQGFVQMFERPLRQHIRTIHKIILSTGRTN